MNIDTFHYLDTIRSILESLPFVEEYSCFGTTAFRVKKKLICRMQEDGATLAIRCHNRDVWMKASPKVFFITDHFKNYPSVLVRLNIVSKKDLTAILTNAWRELAPKKILKEFDGQ